MMKRIIKLSASVLATVVLSLACGHGTAAINRAAAISVFSPNNSTLPMSTSTASGKAGFGSAATSSGLNKAIMSSSSSAISNNSSVAGSTNVSDNSGNSPANNSDKSGSGSGTVTRSGDSAKTNGGSGTTALPKGSGTAAPTKGSENTGNGSTTGKKAGKSDGSNDNTVPVIDGSDTHKQEAAYDISALKREIIAYGESRGLTYNPNMRIESSGYESPTNILQDTLNEADFIKGEKEEIDYQIKQRNYAGADFCPDFIKQSNRTNDYLVYELFG